jgi:hypothetical protein
MLANNVDFLYIIISIVATYGVIKTIESMKGGQIRTWLKRCISAGVAVLLAVVMKYAFHHSGEALFYGFFIQFTVYDYAVKYIINKLETLTKKKTDDELGDEEEVV